MISGMEMAKTRPAGTSCRRRWRPRPPRCRAHDDVGHRHRSHGFPEVVAGLNGLFAALVRAGEVHRDPHEAEQHLHT